MPRARRDMRLRSPESAGVEWAQGCDMRRERVAGTDESKACHARLRGGPAANDGGHVGGHERVARGRLLRFPRDASDSVASSYSGLSSPLSTGEGAGNEEKDATGGLGPGSRTTAMAPDAPDAPLGSPRPIAMLSFLIVPAREATRRRRREGSCPGAGRGAGGLVWWTWIGPIVWGQ